MENASEQPRLSNRALALIMSGCALAAAFSTLRVVADTHAPDRGGLEAAQITDAAPAIDAAVFAVSGAAEIAVALGAAGVLVARRRRE